MRKPVNVDGAVKPAGQYSHAVIANGFVFVSGQGPADPVTNIVQTASPIGCARPYATCKQS